MTVEIAILSYNEAKNLPLVIEALAVVRQRVSNIDFRALVINNGSKDATEDVVRELEKTNDFIRHITIPVNQGYGYGVRQGLSNLEGDIVGFMWGDNQFDAGILVAMLEVFVKHAEIQMVKTYRAKRYDGRLRLWVSKAYQIMFKMLYGVYTQDINSGPKLFRKDFLDRLQPLSSNDWFVDAELMIKASRLIKPQEVREFPIVFYPRTFGKSNVRFTTCFQFFYNLVKYKFVKL